MADNKATLGQGIAWAGFWLALALVLSTYIAVEMVHHVTPHEDVTEHPTDATTQ